MKPSLLVAVVTGLLAVGAGVAIAGLPTTPPAEGLVVTAVPGTTTSTTIAAVPDTVAPLAVATTTTSLEITTTTTLAPSRPLVARGELAIVTANAAGVDGIAGSTAAVLGGIGYGTVDAVDAADVVDQSTVYHRAELVAEAVRLAADLGWNVDRVAPIADAPELVTTDSADLVAMIGLDQVPDPDQP